MRQALSRRGGGTDVLTLAGGGSQPRLRPALLLVRLSRQPLFLSRDRRSVDLILPGRRSSIPRPFLPSTPVSPDVLPNSFPNICLFVEKEEVRTEKRRTVGWSQRMRAYGWEHNCGAGELRPSEIARKGRGRKETVRSMTDGVGRPWVRRGGKLRER